MKIPNLRQGILASTLLLSPSLTAAPVEITSPDGTNVLTVDDSDGSIRYAITSAGQEVVAPTPIGITLNGTALPHSKAKAVRENQVRETVKPVVPTFSASFPDAFNEKWIQFDDGVSLRCRAYDDGVAFRWETSRNDEEMEVNEDLRISFTEDFPVFFPAPNGDGFFSHQECLYPRMKVSETAGKKNASVPLLVERGDDRWMLVSDVNVEGYPGMWLEGTDSTTIQAVFPPYPLETKLDGHLNLKVAKAADYIARTKGTRTFPWRAFALTDDAAGLLTSTLFYNLAEPSRLKNTEWIRPGLVAWDWWNANNIYGVPFRAGFNQETYKHYIDFASEMGAGYIILDEGWSKPGPGGLLEVVPEIDMPALVKYGHSKKVDIILWMGSVALEHDFDRAFDQFSEWGIAGIKVDFMQRDDQVMMDFLYRTAEEAAKHRLLVDFHGGSKPTGLSRTWPNMVTTESVCGLEQNKWGGDANPDMAVLLPFTRMVVGPMDYTPGAMVNQQKNTFRPMNDTPTSQGTRAQQLAMYVVYLSPLQMLADSPTHYRRNPESLPFLKAVPTTWDETRVLKADVGRCVAVARRKGNEWFIGGLTSWEACDLELPLDFLGTGSFEMTVWKDGINADRNGNDVAVETRSVAAKDRLTVHLAPGGGVAAMIRK
ncbi:glycoside hydrolase family 97 protein [Haloferula sargassicola]|uniref:Retaining alpha-galactosidase n=1 Tax=Haloferula sargassicola TaxID=490096 RepID=A0ABP9UKJ5_9BACT